MKSPMVNEETMSESAIPVVAVCTWCGRKYVALGTKTRHGRHFDAYVFRGKVCGGVLRLIDSPTPPDAVNSLGLTT